VLKNLLRAAGSILLLVGAAAPALAQYQITSLDELRRELSAGDLVTVVQKDGDSVTGRLVGVGSGGLNIQPEGRRPKLTVRVNALDSVERQGDSVRNGAVIGALVGATPVLTMFMYALAVDRNEIDEWAPMYLGFGAATTTIGTLAGLAIDRAHSRPRAKFTLKF
jgi:hypothetical protein